MIPPRHGRKQNILNIALFGLEELKHFPSPEAREQALDRQLATSTKKDVLQGIAIIVAAVGTYFVIAWMPRYMGWWRPRIWDDLVPLGAVAVTFLSICYVHRRGSAVALRHALLDSAVPICTRCGYLLKGLPPSTANCPECGTPLDPRATRLLNQPPTRPPNPPV